MKKNIQAEKMMLIASMCIFGTIGIFRRYLPLPSSLVALVRGMIGTVFLLMVVFVQKRRFDKEVIRKNILLLLLSGTAIGFNWIFLFEAYCYTSVAVATLCYYLAPILVILSAPVVLKDKPTVRQVLCAVAALCGMIPVSGVMDAGVGIGSLKGLFYGIGAAILYASVILMNKKMTDINAYDKTVFQLFFATITLLPYVLATESISALRLTLPSVLLLLTVGIIHTGLAYWMYFSSIQALKAQTAALWSYLDPVLAIILSTVLLKEPMSPAAWVGAAVILGSAYLCEK